MLRYLLKRAMEPGTQRTIVLIAGFAGLSGTLAEAAAAAIVAVAGLAAVLLPEPKA